MKIHNLDFENSVDLNDDILATVLGGEDKAKKSIFEICILVDKNPKPLPYTLPRLILTKAKATVSTNSTVTVFSDYAGCFTHAGNTSDK